MKNLLLFVLFLSFNSLILAQDFNKEVISERGTPYLVGKINKKGLLSENYVDWFQKNYEGYEIDQLTSNALKEKLKDYQILAFMGTWCGDSKREIPRFYKVLEATDFPMEQLTMVAVDNRTTYYKQSPTQEEQGLNIHRVPTFILYQNGKEVNRIIESPINSLEKDLLQIITKEEYVPNYKVVHKLHELFGKRSLRQIQRKAKRMLPVYKEEVANVYELNTYAKKLFTIDEMDKAIYVYNLNATLFPEEPVVYFSLGQLFEEDDKELALKHYKQALKLAPKNQKIIAAIERVEAHIASN